MRKSMIIILILILIIIVMGLLFFKGCVKDLIPQKVTTTIQEEETTTLLSSCTQVCQKEGHGYGYKSVLPDGSPAYGSDCAIPPEVYVEYGYVGESPILMCCCGTMEEEEDPCTDTDGGNDIYLKGTCSDTEGGGSTDVCPIGAWTQFVSEAYCGEEDCLGVSTSCPTDYLCYDGACESLFEDHDGDGYPTGWELDWGGDPMDGLDFPFTDCTNECLTNGYFEWEYVSDIMDAESMDWEERYFECDAWANEYCLSQGIPSGGGGSVEDIYCCCYGCFEID